MRHHTGKYADFFVKININNKIESLNISNSAAIVFHHLKLYKKRVEFNKCFIFACPCSSLVEQLICNQ